MARAIVMVYGVVAYAVTMAVIAYGVGFVGGFAVPRSVDAGGAETPFGAAAAIDVALAAVFAVQHSVMARPAFKRAWKRVVPEAAERSTYCVLSAAAMALVFWQWRPVGGSIWDLGGAAPVGWAAFALGWVLVVVSTFLIDHFDLFGLRQVWLFARGTPYTPPPFRVRGLYRVVRHPLMLGFVIAFWATPRMSGGHLLFAIAMTAYIVLGVVLEERDLARVLGDDYARYRRETPAIVPFLKVP